MSQIELSSLPLGDIVAGSLVFQFFLGMRQHALIWWVLTHTLPGPTSQEAEREVGQHTQTTLLDSEGPSREAFEYAPSHWSGCSQSLTSQLIGRWRQEDYKFISRPTWAAI